MENFVRLFSALITALKTTTTTPNSNFIFQKWKLPKLVASPVSLEGLPSSFIILSFDGFHHFLIRFRRFINYPFASFQRRHIVFLYIWEIDPSLFERSRSLRSISLSQTGQNIGHTEEDDDDELDHKQQPRFAGANNMKRE